MKKIVTLGFVSILALNGIAQTKKPVKSTEASPAQETAIKVAAPVASAEPATKATTPITEEQKAKLKEINKDFKMAKQQIESDTTLSTEQKESKIKEASKAKSKKLKEVFTPEQLQEMKDARKKKENE